MHLNSDLSPRYLSQPLAAPDPRYLDHLVREHPGTPLASWATWGEGRRQLSGGAIWREDTDATLCPILTTFKQGDPEVWHQVLLYLLWPHLDRIARRLSQLDDDPNQIDSQVCWAFLEALHRFDLDRRQTRLGQKILNDVLHDVRLHYADERELGKRFMRPVTREEADKLEAVLNQAGAPDPEFEWIDNRHEARWARAYLKNLVRSGRLDGADYLILLGCHVYGRTLHEMAARLGLSYEAAKKRQQRTVKYLRKSPRKLSPSRPPDPLGGVKGHRPGRRDHDRSV